MMIYVNSNAEMLFADFYGEQDEAIGMAVDEYRERVVQAGIKVMEDEFGYSYVANNVNEVGDFRRWNGGDLSHQARMYKNRIAGRFVTVTENVAGKTVMEVCGKADTAMTEEIEKIRKELIEEGYSVH